MIKCVLIRYRLLKFIIFNTYKDKVLNRPQLNIYARFIWALLFLQWLWFLSIYCVIMSILWSIKYAKRTYDITVWHDENRLNIHVNEYILWETYKNMIFQQKENGNCLFTIEKQTLTHFQRCIVQWKRQYKENHNCIDQKDGMGR